MMNSPLIYHFKTRSGNHYIYDACTDYVYPTQEIDFQVIKNYKKYSYAELIKKMSKKYTTDEINISYQKISHWMKYDGAFFPKWEMQPKVKVPTQKEYERQLANLDQLILELTQQCNLRCKYCVFGGNYEFQREHNNSRMSWEVAKNSLDYYLSLLDSPLRIRPSKKAVLSFYGGESLIEFKLMQQCVEYIKSQPCTSRINFNLTTNGTLFSEKVIRFFIENAFSVCVSLDGPIQEHDKNRIFLGGKGSFETIAKNLQKIYDLNKDYYKNRVIFLSTYTPSTNLIKLIEFFGQKDRHLFYKKVKRMSPLSPNGILQSKRSANTEIKKQMEQRKYLFCRYLELKGKKDLNSSLLHPLETFLNLEFDTLYKKYRSESLNKNIAAAICLPGALKLFVSVEGKFHACEKVNDQFPIGDCWSGVNYEKVVEVLRKFQENICNKCSNCIAMRQCSICFASVAKNGEFKKDDLCKKVVSSLKNRLKIFYSAKEKVPTLFN